ncbi:hypothetical protein PATSB16_04250 [Pandoraea thiooxydans]|nr:hypothetical protein PATSB16_04250 [Pandoraea thiooxydans]
MWFAVIGCGAAAGRALEARGSGPGARRQRPARLGDAG